MKTVAFIDSLKDHSLLKKGDEIEVVETDNSSTTKKVIKTTLIVLGVIAAVAATLFVLYEVFKKYFKIDFECGDCSDCDEQCFDEYSVPDDESFEPKCDADDE